MFFWNGSDSFCKYVIFTHRYWSGCWGWN